jgi:hypothetical protein
MAKTDLTFKLEMTAEDLRKALLELEEENRKTMATISANTEPTEEFSLSELDYDELLEVYGDDPVLMTIFNRMKHFFAGGRVSEEWFRIKDWPSPRVATPSGGSTGPYLHWDTSTWDTTTKVSDTFTIRSDTNSGTYTIHKDASVKYDIK